MELYGGFINEENGCLQRFLSLHCSFWPGETTACSGMTIEMLDTLLRWLLYWIFHSIWQHSDDREIETDNEIINKEETDYRERGKNRRKKHLQALVPSEPDNRSSGITVVQPSFVMDQPNKKQTWLYDTPGIINEKQVWWTVLFSSAMLLQCPEWPLATYLCFLMTTVRNVSFFIKNHILGTLDFTGSKFLACYNIFLRAQPWDLPVCWVLDWMIFFLSKLLWSEWTIVV